MKLYVYALTDARLPRRRLHGHDIETIAFGDVRAIVERTSRMPEISEHALCEQHDIVHELSQQIDAILPARFGSLVEREELASIVAARHRQLVAALQLVRHREQMTVRLVGRARTGEAAQQPEASPRTAGPGARYLQERRAAAGYPLPDAAARLTASVRPLIVADRAEPGQDPVRAVLYHLIERGSSAAYCRALAAAGSVSPFRVKVTGPWPPFAFVPEVIG